MKRFASICLLTFALNLTAASQPLRYEHIPSAIDEMLTYHVEYSQLNPLLIRRSFNVFISRFDSQQTYLLRSEVVPYLSFSELRVSNILNEFNSGKFPEYVSLNKTIISSIQRARKLRASIKTQLLKDDNLDLTALEERPYQIADTQNDLLQITSIMMKNWLVYHAKDKNLKVLDQPDRLKVLNYFEKKKRAHEEQYLVNFEKNEPLFALNILKSMAASLDAHTMYYSASEANEIRTILQKQFCGVGIHLKEGVEGSFVASVIENSPAHRSGVIQKGDLLRQINSQPVEDLYFKDVLKKMEGPQNSKVAFMFERQDTQERINITLKREKISLESDRIQVNAIPFADGVIGTIAMTSFYENDEGMSLESDIRDALRELKTHGKIYGLVIDMRSNSGGFLTQAIKTAGLFVKSGVVVIAKYANDQIRYQKDLDPRQYYNGPLVILTSKASASAAEVLAATLQDEGVGVIVGDEWSYGKGTMQYQTLTDPDSRDFYKVTVGRFYTVSGKSTQMEGVKSDIVVNSIYAPYRIGEKYLRYPLEPENISYRKNIKEDVAEIFSAYRARKSRYLEEIMPILKRNSKLRLKNNQNYTTFQEEMELKKHGKTKDGPPEYGQDDIQMEEGLSIVKDMIMLKQN